MNEELNKLLKETQELLTVIKNAQIQGNSFDQQYGWNQVHIQKDDLVFYISNFIKKIELCAQLKELLSEVPLIEHALNVNRLTSMTRSYFTSNGSHLISTVPTVILTLLTIDNYINNNILNWDFIEDNKLLPRSISGRLRSYRTQLDSYEELFGDVDNKIKTINDVHEAAESLPTDLQSLKDAKNQLNIFLKNAQKEFDKSRNEIEQIKNKISLYESQSADACNSAKSINSKINEHESNAQKLVDKCDTALQITTTQGLAAGFDQKAKELRNSIWVWIFGLLIALGTGAHIGAQRVDAFTIALQSNLTAGQALLHTIISIFSIGGPLWLAWISTQQINQRFKLSEDYSYKATIAKSFTGFSRFAERFDEATEQRLFNSTLDRFDEMPLRLVEGKDYNSPWHEFIDSEAFKKALDMVPALAKEAGRFVNSTKLKQKPKIKPTENKPSPEQPLPEES